MTDIDFEKMAKKLWFKGMKITEEEIKDALRSAYDQGRKAGLEEAKIYRKALDVIGSIAGHPNASEGCRLILEVCEEALKGKRCD